VLRTAGGVQVYEASLDMGGGSVRECSAVGLRDNSYGGGVQVHLESVAKLSDVEVVGCEARSERESFGGGVQVHSHGRLEMVGGSISDCAALSALDAVFGGGLQVASSAQANLSDVIVHGNAANSSQGQAYGGGVQVTSSALEMRGGVVRDCVYATAIRTEGHATAERRRC
jgi:hypothetical protein